MKKKISLLFLASLIFGGVFFLYFGFESWTQLRIKHSLQHLLGQDVALLGYHLEWPTKERGWRTLGFQVRTIKIKNPRTFLIPNSTLIENVRAEFDWPLFFINRLEFNRISASMSKAEIELNRRGELNLSFIKALAPSPLEKPSRVRIDHYEVSLGTLYFLDFRSQPPFRYRHNFQKQVLTYENITDPNLLFQAPLVSMLKVLKAENFGSPDTSARKAIESFFELLPKNPS